MTCTQMSHSLRSSPIWRGLRRRCLLVQGLLVSEEFPDLEGIPVPKIFEPPLSITFCYRISHLRISEEVAAMSRRRAKPTQHSAVCRQLHSPQYRMRVVRNRKGYNRKDVQGRDWAREK